MLPEEKELRELLEAKRKVDKTLFDQCVRFEKICAEHFHKVEKLGVKDIFFDYNNSMIGYISHDDIKKEFPLIYTFMTDEELIKDYKSKKGL